MRFCSVLAPLLAAALLRPVAAVAEMRGAETSAAQRPSLVVVIAVDQLRRDRLDPGLPGGLGRLAREGQVHTEALLEHAATETCPGHLSMLTGRHPGPAGVTSNSYIDEATGERRYCVEDRAPDAAVIGGLPEPSDGRSPRNLSADTLGDWMKTADPETRVFAVSAKDRAAITLGGQHPDGVYWLWRGHDPGFTTSLYYRAQLPSWVEAWNAVGLATRVPQRWEHAVRAFAAAPTRVDDFEGESDERSRTSPHPLYDDDPEELAENLYRSPFVDDLTLDFARTLVAAEDLGGRDRPDLLAISLSGTDTIGHAYGPWSLESRDALERLDAVLGGFLATLEARVGPGRLLVVLTSDHGVLPLPEWLAATGRLSCPVPGGRLGLLSLILGLYWELHVELSPFSWPTPWMDVASQLTVNRALAKRREIPVDRVVAVAERWLEKQPGVREAWTRKEIAQRDSDLARLYRNSFTPGRSGDLAVQFEPTCLADFDGSGTSHGSVYAYDRAVPLVFWGAGIDARRVPGRAATIDIAPTLAARLGLAVPAGLDGRNLIDRARSNRVRPRP